MKKNETIEIIDKEMDSMADFFETMGKMTVGHRFANYVCKMTLRNHIIDDLMEDYFGNKLNNRLAEKLTPVIKRYIEDFDKIIKECK